jgi:uncharacterized protein (DUF1330 family)
MAGTVTEMDAIGVEYGHFEQRRQRSGVNMVAYVVVTRLHTRNPAELELYRERNRGIPPESQFKRLATWTDTFEVKEGPNVEGVAIFEFPSLAKAKAWYESAEYQTVVRHRFLGGDYNFIIVEGLRPQ